jgi:hypothetical protein
VAGRILTIDYHTPDNQAQDVLLPSMPSEATTVVAPLTAATVDEPAPPAATALVPGSSVAPSARVDRPTTSAREPAESSPIPAQDRRLAELRRVARRHQQAGRGSQALDAVVEGLKIDPADRPLTETLNQLLRDAQSAAERGTEEARKAGAPTRSGAEFNEALRHTAEATKLKDRRPADATRRYWVASAAFAKLASAPPVSATTTRADPPTQTLTALDPPTPAIQPDPSPPSLTSSSDESRPPITGTSTLSRTAPSVAAPPPSRSAVVPRPTAPAPNEEQRVLDVLNQYRSAYERLDPAGVNRLHPTVSQSQLATVFAQYRSYTMTITEPKISIAGDEATVVGTVGTNIRPRVGDVQSSRRETTFRLQKTGDQWTIIERR